MYANVFWCKRPLWCVSLWTLISAGIQFQCFDLSYNQYSVQLGRQNGCFRSLLSCARLLKVQMPNPDLVKQKTFHRDKTPPQINSISNQIKFLCCLCSGSWWPSTVTQIFIRVDATLLHWVSKTELMLCVVCIWFAVIGTSKLLHFFVLPEFVFQICSPLSCRNCEDKLPKTCGGNCDTGQSESVERNIANRHGKGNHLSLACCLTILPNKRI